MTRNPVFVTLGPEGTNHHTMVKAYAEFRGLSDYVIHFVDDFKDALLLVECHDADYVLICGVHPQCAMVVGEGRYRHGIYLMDTFISPTQPLGILTRRDVETPRTLALQPATAGYTDISRWPEKSACEFHHAHRRRPAEGRLRQWADRFESGRRTS